MADGRGRARLPHFGLLRHSFLSERPRRNSIYLIWDNGQLVYVLAFFFVHWGIQIHGKEGPVHFMSSSDATDGITQVPT